MKHASFVIFIGVKYLTKIKLLIFRNIVFKCINALVVYIMLKVLHTVVSFPVLQLNTVALFQLLQKILLCHFQKNLVTFL